MILPQTYLNGRKNFGRALPPPRLNTRHDMPRRPEAHSDSLEELADIATQQLRIATPRLLPSPFSGYALSTLEKPWGHYDTPQLRLPSFQDTFSDVIAAADRSSQPQDEQHQRSHGSPGLEIPWRRSISSSLPALSPLSTAHSSPVITPVTPPAHHSNQSSSSNSSSNNSSSSSNSNSNSGSGSGSGNDNNQHYYPSIQSPPEVQAPLPLPVPNDDQARQRQCLALVRPRRAQARAAPYSLDRPQTRRAAPPAQPLQDGERKRHFNQKYKNPDKLFILYHKVDLRWGWPAIQARRLQLLPVLLGSDYDREVEEARQVAGLNGMYYRENDLNMPVLTPDGSGLVFVERDGRWWELTQSQKCRSGDHHHHSNSNKVVGRKPGAAEQRPRGMVERYPEEVLLYWDDHVQYFIPEERRYEVYARAVRYCEIRAEQRRQYDVPQWALDNKEERVLDPKRPKKTADDILSASRGRVSRRSRRV